MSARARWTSERGSLWTLDLDGSALRSVSPRCPATFSEAGTEHAALLAAAMGLPDRGSVLQRLGGAGAEQAFGDPRSGSERSERGRRCFLVWVEGMSETPAASLMPEFAEPEFAERRTTTTQERLAAYGWVSYGYEYVGELERTFRIRDDEVYIWDCMTLPEYRGQGVYSALLSCILAQLRSEGVRRAWIGAALANRPSVKGIMIAGFQPVIRVVYARLFNLHYIWVTSFPEAPGPLVAAARGMVITGRERALGPLVVGIG